MIMTSGPITSWRTEGEKMEAVTDFIFLGSEITADSDCSDCNHEMKRHLPLGRETMTNLVGVLKNKNVLWTKVRLVKGVAFPVVMYRCEIWTK